MRQSRQISQLSVTARDASAPTTTSHSSHVGANTASAQS
jgi:hypothetical protein